MARPPRFAKLVRKLAARRGKRKVTDPAALAAWIGRKKYGTQRFQQMAAAGRRKKSRR